MQTGENKSIYAIYAGGLIAIGVVILQAFIPLDTRTFIGSIGS